MIVAAPSSSSASSMFALFLSLLIYYCLASKAASETSSESSPRVLTLNGSNFDETVASADPQQLFLFKFYAPWCGHCKSLAPVLEKVAQKVDQKSLQIGKIDCTQSDNRSLCSTHNVRGYPTLIAYRDGEFFEYSGDRAEKSFVQFANKMNSAPVSLVSTAAQIIEKANASPDRIVFCMFDAEAAVGENDGAVQAYMNSTSDLKAFSAVARKMQPKAVEMVVLTNPVEAQKLGFAASKKVAKMEDLVEPLFYFGEMAMAPLHQWVSGNNSALVAELGSHNFKNIGEMGRPMAIAVLDADGKSTQSVQLLNRVREVAKVRDGPFDGRYSFCWIDGSRWKRFLSQFEVALNEVFVYDMPKQHYWQDAEASEKNLHDFLEGVLIGKYHPKERQQPVQPGIIETLMDTFLDGRPYSYLIFIPVVFIFAQIILLFYDIGTAVVDGSGPKGKNINYKKKSGNSNNSSLKGGRKSTTKSPSSNSLNEGKKDD